MGDDARADQSVASGGRGESVTRGTVVLSGAQACMLVSNAAINIVAARMLLKADYGRFVVVMPFLAWTNMIVSSIVLPGLRKVVSEDRARFPAAVSFGARWHTLASAAAMVLLAVSARPLAGLLGDAALAPLFLIAAIQVPLMGTVRLCITLQTSLRRFGASGLVRVIYAFCYPIVGCALLLAGLGAMGGVAGAVAAALIAAVAAVALLMREHRGMTVAPYPPMARRVAHWASVSLPNIVGLGVLMMLGVWLVKGMLDDPGLAGVYGVAYFGARAPMFVVFGLGAAVFSKVSSALAEGQPEQARYVAVRAMRVILIVFVPVSAIAAVAASEAVEFVYSVRYAGASPCLVILAPAILCAAQLHLSGRLMDAAHRPGARLVMTSCLVVWAVACYVVLIRRWGIEGAAVASLVTFGLGAIAATALACRFLGVVPPVWTAARCVAAGAVAFAAGWFWSAPGWLVVVKIAVLGLLYAGALVATRELTWRDVSRALHRVRR